MTNSVKTNDFNEILTGRRSIRKYDPSVKISKEEMTEILTEATLAPLAKFNQSQVETSSAMIALFGDLNNFDNAEEIYGTAVERGFMPAEVKEDQMKKLSAYFSMVTPEVMKDTVLIDGGLVAMQFMLAARAHGYDTCPIGGFEKDQIAEAFGLDKERYVPVMLISVGKAADSGYQSVRLPIEKVAEWR